MINKGFGPFPGPLPALKGAVLQRFRRGLVPRRLESHIPAWARNTPDNMRKALFLMAVTLICFTACGQRRNGTRGPRQGGHMEINKDSDSVFVALRSCFEMSEK